MSTVPDLSVEIAGIELRNPVVLASGTVGYGEEFEGLLDWSRVGGISVKGTSARPIVGNPAPRLFPTSAGMLNSIGLQNVGVDAFIRDKMPFLRNADCPVFVNVFGFSIDEYIEVVEKLNACDGIAAYELNISCPNTKEGGMVFGTRADATGDLTRQVKNFTTRPVIVKLSPNVTDIAEIARAAEAAGADALTIANTYLAMAIDPVTFRPRIETITGGLSGPAIRPITLRMVYQSARAVRIPIFGLGGVCSGDSAAEYLLAGASAVQVGTANFEDPKASIRIIDELRRYLARKRIGSVRDLVGSVRAS